MRSAEARTRSRFHWCDPMSFRRIKDSLTTLVAWTMSILVTVLTAAIAAALLHRSLPILAEHPLMHLVLGETWEPMNGEFGLRAFILGTVWVTVLAMLLATPICLLTAIYLAEYAGPGAKAAVRPLVDVLAGIPSVVYGLFGVLVIVPLIQDHLTPFAEEHLAGVALLSPRPESGGYCVLAGGLVLALMVAPVIISVAEEVLRGVPVGIREASLSLGATRWETVAHVTLRHALPGLVAAVVLGFSRAFGETMAVLMVVGNVVAAPQSVFAPAYPLPALIANNYGEMMSVPLYDSALLLAALVLLVVVLAFNLLAQGVLALAQRRAAR